VLSALGLIASERRRDTARTVLLSGTNLTRERIAAEVSELRDSIGSGIEDATAEAIYELRYLGQAFELAIPGALRPDPSELAERFAAEHERRYGYRDPDAGVELVNIRLALVVAAPAPEPRAAPEGGLAQAVRRARFGGEWLEARVLRGEPPSGATAEGPCVLELPEATLVLPPGWRASVDDHGTIAAVRAR
jgi:N-methylhydantoinase A